jgi:proline racemase
MRARLAFTAVDSHTEGMPTRVVTSGVGTLPGATMAERRRHVIDKRDELRTLLMYEPRGHSAMSGAILQPPTRDDADIGVVFIEVSGCLPMCGHGTIGVATVLVETGMVEVAEPVTTIRLDTPAGLVEARVDVEDGRATAVELRNVPSFLALADAVVDLPGAPPLTVDVAWGGNFYAILPGAALEFDVVPAEHDRLVADGLRVMDAVNDQLSFVHPEMPDVDRCGHVIFTAPGGAGASSRGAVVIHPGWIDRSPCGTGTSARMAALHARGRLSLGEPFVHESLIGTRFEGRLSAESSVGDVRAVLPIVRGRAWLTGLATYLLDPDDPFPGGFLMGARG